MAEQPVDFNAFLRQKYAILQQQANADTERAGATTLTAGAAANLDRTRANLLPTESAAAVALQRAQTALTGNQAQTVLPESRARINLLGTEAGLNTANIGLIGENTVAAKRNNRLISILPDSLRSVMGGTSVGGLGAAPADGTVPFTGFRLGAPIATQRNMTADELDRLNGLL